MKVFKALLSGGTKNEDTNQETRATIGLLASGLVYACRPNGGGVSLFAKSIREKRGAPPCFIATRKLYHALVGVSHAEWNPRNTQRRLTTQESPCIEITKLPAAQDQGHNASTKLWGATSTRVRLSQH